MKKDKRWLIRFSNLEELLRSYRAGGRCGPEDSNIDSAQNCEYPCRKNVPVAYDRHLTKRQRAGSKTVSLNPEYGRAARECRSAQRPAEICSEFHRSSLIPESYFRRKAYIPLVSPLRSNNCHLALPIVERVIQRYAPLTNNLNKRSSSPVPQSSQKPR
jgi:hypothetical protein